MSDPKNCKHSWHRLGGIVDCPVCSPERWKLRTFMRNGKAEAKVTGPLTHSTIEVMAVSEHLRRVKELEKLRIKDLEELKERMEDAEWERQMGDDL